jgi:hypothetical protein
MQRSYLNDFLALLAVALERRCTRIAVKRDVSQMALTLQHAYGGLRLCGCFEM